MAVREYDEMLRQLLPLGIAIDADYQCDAADLVYKTAVELHAAAELDLKLFNELDPRLSTLLLSEWEASLGLPDKCSVGAQTLEERQKNVYAKIVSNGGARRTRYLAILNALGYENATIERSRLWTCEMPCDQPVFDDPQWRFIWRVDLGQDSNITEWTCADPCDQHLRTWGDTFAECIILRENSIMSKVLFAYGEHIQ